MAFNHLPKQIKSVSAGSRDFLAYAEVLKGRRHVLVTRYRRRLEIIESASSYRYAFLRRGAPRYGLRPVGQRDQERASTYG
jgi:hypothetical protein